MVGAGFPVVLIAAVSGGLQDTPPSQVTFYDGPLILRTVAAGGEATTFSTSSLSPGIHLITASYAGNDLQLPSTSNTLTILVWSSGAPAALTASPDPIALASGSMVGATTLSWNAPFAESVEIHLGTPYGPLFAAGPSSGSAVTGEWVADGMVFLLQDVTGGKPLTYENTLATLVISAQSTQATLTASPNPIITGYGQVFGAATLQWNAPSAEAVEVHVGSPACPLFARAGSSGSETTNLWVTNGMTFYLQDITNGKPLTPGNTLATLVMSVQQQGTIQLTPNPISVAPGSLLGTTTVEWYAPSAQSVEIHIGSPSGPLFAAYGSSGTATTGEWVTDGMTFYLQDVTGGKPLTAANTLGVAIAHVQSF